MSSKFDQIAMNS